MLKRLVLSSFFVFAMFGAGCGDDGPTPPPTPDAAEPDAPPAVAPTCESYCTAVVANCVDADAQYNPNDQATCVAACEAAAWDPGTADDTTGNTIGCHEYHGNAAADDPTTHCPHAGPNSEVCVAAAR